VMADGTSRTKPSKIKQKKAPHQRVVAQTN
jgi:hypothetical protein